MEQQLILDRYRPLEELGEGGFATVTLAWDTRMQRRVAIKRLELPRDHTGRIMHDPPGLAEARTAALLNHPAIVTVYDFETDSDEAFLIMEHVDGASVGAVLDGVGGALTLDETAAVVEAVGSALAYAHENGVLHLDIKPANVLVTREGRVKVADFGMAELSSLAGHGPSFGGTIGYMPIEQLGGLRVDATSDEWALAVLTFECLTGADPFDADDLASALVLLETTDLPSVTAYEPGVPRAIDDVLFAATGPHPEDRYPSVAAFVSAVRPYLGDPEAGHASLAELVDSYAQDEGPAEEPGWSRVGLWDRMQGRAGSVALRAIATVESAWLAWAGLAPTHLQPLPVAGAVALVALAGALAPSLGTGLGLLAFAIGLFALGLWPFASAFLLAALAWWWLVARRSAGAAVLPLAAPVLGVAYVAFLEPLLAGFALPALPAAAAGFAGGLLQVTASAASAQGAPFLGVSPPLFADPTRALLVAEHVRAALLAPTSWLMVAGWAVAAGLMSLPCRRATRFSALVGTALAGGVLLGTNMLARLLAVALGGGHEAAGAAWTSGTFVGSLSGSLILVVLVIVLGAPVRAEEEDLVRPTYATDDAKA